MKGIRCRDLDGQRFKYRPLFLGDLVEQPSVTQLGGLQLAEFVEYVGSWYFPYSLLPFSILKSDSTSFLPRYLTRTSSQLSSDVVRITILSHAFSHAVMALLPPSFVFNTIHDVVKFITLFFSAVEDDKKDAVIAMDAKIIAVTAITDVLFI